MTHLSVEEGLRGVGLELLLKAEELIYATRSLTETQCEELGSDLYLLAQVLGSILQQKGKKLESEGFDLPDTVGSVRIKNPYFDSRSEKPNDEAAGQSDDFGGELPF
jgi:hypothetical protein